MEKYERNICGKVYEKIKSYIYVWVLLLTWFCIAKLFVYKTFLSLLTEYSLIIKNHTI